MIGEARCFLRLGDIAAPSIVESHVGELELTELTGTAAGWDVARNVRL